MTENLEVNIEDLAQFSYLGIGVNKEFGNEIKNKLKKKFGSITTVSRIVAIPTFTINQIGRRNTRQYIWIKILKLLKLSLKDLEPNITSICDKFIYHIKFPHKVTPLHIRLISHILGDGCYCQGSSYWIQKNVEPLILLEKKLLGISGKKVKYDTADHVSIPAFYTKLICSFLKVRRSKLRSKKFFDKIIELPKPFRIELIAAILEDEARILPNTGSIRISMKSRTVLEGLAKIFDSLNYDRSEIKKVSNKGSFGESFLYQLFLRVMGSNNFYQDLQELVSEYGESADLWSKKNNFEMLISRNDGKKAEGRELNWLLAIKVISNFSGNKIITARKLMKMLKVDRPRADRVIRRLTNENLIKQKNRGVYLLSLKEH